MAYEWACFRNVDHSLYDGQELSSGFSNESYKGIKLSFLPEAVLHKIVQLVLDLKSSTTVALFFSILDLFEHLYWHITCILYNPPTEGE